MRSHRLRVLAAAGLVDSFGLALGWTVFNLHAVARGGLASVGLYNAAMLVGVALSAPATAWLAPRLHTRTLLRATAAVEVAGRVGTFALLLGGAPPLVVALAVALMNVVAWTGFACMRAEVAAADARPVAMTTFMTCIAAIEAVGAAVAALLPSGGGLLAVVVAVYGASLVPTWLSARGARVPKAAPAPARAGRDRGTVRRAAPLAGAALVMLLGSGPTLLVVGLAAELHGPASVAGAAAAFTLGSLLAPAAVALVGRRPGIVTWPLWGAGMLVGWVAAPWSVVGLLGAQLLSGLCKTALEGTMDAATAGGGHATARLAGTAAARAFGSAGAVALLPALVAAPEVGTFGAGVAGGLAVAAGLGLLAWRLRRAGAPAPVSEGA